MVRAHYSGAATYVRICTAGFRGQTGCGKCVISNFVGGVYQLVFEEPGSWLSIIVKHLSVRINVCIYIRTLHIGKHICLLNGQLL